MAVLVVDNGSPFVKDITLCLDKIGQDYVLKKYYEDFKVSNFEKVILSGRQKYKKEINSANSKIRAYFPTNTIQINHIEFIERYDDIALSAFIQLFKAQADLKIIFPKKGIDSSPGNRSRIVLENTAEWWNRITVVEREKEKATDLPQMSFSLSSKKASEDKRQVYSKTDTLDNLLSIISKEKHWDEKIAHTIYELMIPNDFKENLKNKDTLLGLWMKPLPNILGNC